VFVNLLEEFVPSSYQLALGLVLNKFKFIFSPAFLNVSQELFKDELTSGLCKDFIDNLLILEEVSMNEVRDCEFIETDLFQGEFCQQIFPVTLLHGLTLELTNHFVHLYVS
jgi:hypothetical protein